MDKVQSIILWHPKMLYSGIPKVAVTTCQKQFHDKFETFIGSRISKERCIESWFTLTAFSAKSHLKFYSSAETCWLLNIIEFEYLTYEDEYCSNPLPQGHWWTRSNSIYFSITFRNYITTLNFHMHFTCVVHSIAHKYLSTILTYTSFIYSLVLCIYRIHFTFRFAVTISILSDCNCYCSWWHKWHIN